MVEDPVLSPVPAEVQQYVVLSADCLAIRLYLYLRGLLLLYMHPESHSWKS